MATDFATSLCFAVGVFTPEQKAERDRRLLAEAEAGKAIAPAGPQLDIVYTTIYKMAAETLLASIQPTGQANGSTSFEIERFAADWHQAVQRRGSDPQQAFKDWLASPQGQQKFGTATSVQLFAANLMLTH